MISKLSRGVGGCIGAALGTLIKPMAKKPAVQTQAVLKPIAQQDLRVAKRPSPVNPNVQRACVSKARVAKARFDAYSFVYGSNSLPAPIERYFDPAWVAELYQVALRGQNTNLKPAALSAIAQLQICLGSLVVTGVADPGGRYLL
jgi:hypothetical protein